MGRSYPGAARVVQSRHSKTMLLPLSRAKADELGLRNHVALASMREGKGSVNAAQTLLEMVMASGFLAEAGYGQLDPAQALGAEKAVCGAIDRGKETDCWFLEPAEFDELVRIVTLYDGQLRDAPLSALAVAGERLTRFKAGQSFGLPGKGRL
jgi:hypothetical protein